MNAIESASAAFNTKGEFTVTVNEVKAHLCDLITSYAKQLGNTQTLETLQEAYKLIEEYDRIAPTAHWDINCDGYYPFCSNCKESPAKMSKYCPNCGAKMTTRGADK